MTETRDGREVVKLPSYLDAAGVLTCPACGCQDFEVYRVGNWRDGHKPRQRECSNCHRLIYTREVVDECATSNNDR